MGKDANTLDDLRRAILHQTVVGGNIGFALGGVDNECVDFVAAAAQLGAGRETRAAQSDHAKLVNTLNQRFAGFILVIVPAIAFNPAVFAIGINNHAHFRQRGRVGGRVGSNGPPPYRTSGRAPAAFCPSRALTAVPRRTRSPG